MYSYHIFYFPFKWKVKGRESLLFAEQTNLDNIEWNPYSNWLGYEEITKEKELNELYNEKNYYYEFVHPVLYDTNKPNSILKHFERKEPKQHDVSYIISKKNGKTYTLKVDAINLNLYTTGVGMLTFHLVNERDDQKKPEDILMINQLGRRIFPPHTGEFTYRKLTADSIGISGLSGEPSLFYEDYSSYTNKDPWKPACFIRNLITDAYGLLKITPVIDDRMYVNCWYGYEGYQDDIKNAPDKFIEKDNFWYQFVFVDDDGPTCKNERMYKQLVSDASYLRWQQYGSLFGISRYSFVALTDESDFNKNTLVAVHMRTIYARMVELILIQRASTLRFSDEVTRVSRLSKENKVEKEVIEQVASLYKEYIRFINQVHFREITTQDQGIELYNLMTKTLMIKEYIQDLDKEIEELYQYVNILDDKVRNRNASNLNILATVLLPVTVLAALFSMNANNLLCGVFWKLVAYVFIVAAFVSFGFIWFLINKKK